jgi:hypothetical protein
LVLLQTFCRQLSPKYYNFVQILEVLQILSVPVDITPGASYARGNKKRIFGYEFEHGHGPGPEHGPAPEAAVSCYCRASST